jgi:methionyl-tRNA formyltransferase
MTRVLILADGAVGKACVEWLLANYPADVGLVVTATDNAISAGARKAGIPTVIFESASQVVTHAHQLGLVPDIGLLLWWPRIIKQPLIGLPKNGFVNTHPSLLPYNRGKHYNFWAILEQAPFGVTLHLVDEGVDTGPILFQAELDHGWEDTGETLYLRAQSAMIDLVKASYPALRDGELMPRPQDAEHGSFHRADELEAASRIALDEETTARKLFNRLRARTFPGYPGCRFEDNGRTYDITVSIKDVT